ncbi:MAG: RidA family protein [Vicinamibacterales bacterium]|jgi:enamine deaminase RidA (YjgF/YER057c/UK114 family)|nr:RidA family protein [Vicinamibacterales bacterium]
MQKRTCFAVVVALSGFAVGATPVEAQVEKAFINPAGGYTQVVSVEDREVKTVYVSGQVGRGADLQAHAESAFSGVAEQLSAAGASMRDVVKIRIYVAGFDPADYGVISAARLAAFPEDAWPVSTMLGVNSLAREEFRVEIEATAVVAAPGADFELTRIGPSRGFSQAVVARHGTIRTIWIAGQTGRGDDLTAQTGVVFDRVSERLADAGATMDDVVKINTYIVDFRPDEDMRPFSQGRSSVFGENPPSSTLVGIDRLVNDRIQIEVDAVAVVGSSGRTERLTKEFLDGAGSFTQVVTARGDGAKTIYVSGQVGRAGEPLEMQAQQAFAGMKRRLAAAGATPADLVKVIYYLPGYSPGNTGIAAAREANAFPTENLPASTLLGIQSLYSETALFEYEGIAVVQP